MDLYLLSFNNYYNRQVKKFDDFADYEPYILHVVNNYNFVSGDGVDTILKAINYDGETQPDYALVVDGITIKSRWFVIDMDFIRQGQYQITLHRDVVADSYNDIIDAPCYIEKATVGNDDIAVYNKEQMGFNQIKKTETPLMDETKTPWIVGYIPSDTFKEDTLVNSTFVNAGNPDITVSKITDWPYYKYTQLSSDRKSIVQNPQAHFSVRFTAFPYINGRPNYESKAQYSFNLNGQTVPGETFGDRTYGIGSDVVKTIFRQKYDDNYLTIKMDSSNANIKTDNFYGNLAICLRKKIEGSTLYEIKQTLTQELTTKLGYDFNENTLQELRNLNGKKIFDSTNKTLYRISFTKDTVQGGDIPTTIQFVKTHFPKGFIYISSDGVITFDGSSGMPAETIGVFEQIDVYRLNLTQEDINIKTTVLGTKNRTHLVDGPYDMFCMPYYDSFEITNAGKITKNSKFAALNMAVAVGIGSGLIPDPDKPGEMKEDAGKVYDIQLLPYCPIRNAIVNGKFDITGIPHNAITSADGTKIYSYMIWCDKSDFSFDIPYEIKVEDYKLSNECDMYRLTSPNFASAFEFSAAQNKGVSKFNVDATYKPFNPYIHINPDFKGLYGSDFNDARGLILGGDFSITQLSSAWANYELTNKNFQASFDRNIQNMTVSHDVQREQQQWNAAFGALQSTMLGGVMGNYGMGKTPWGVAGGIGGAAVGLGLGVAAGVRDIQLGEKLRTEALDYAHDQFNYQIANIKAIPYTLTKTTALTANNKLFPIIEYYSCSDTEKRALQDKIRYNGMTINRIGTIAEFIRDDESYIKGKIIRLNIPEDFHYINSISAEINKGIFIKRGN